MIKIVKYFGDGWIWWKILGILDDSNGQILEDIVDGGIVGMDEFLKKKMVGILEDIVCGVDDGRWWG